MPASPAAICSFAARIYRFNALWQLWHEREIIIPAMQWQQVLSTGVEQDGGKAGGKKVRIPLDDKDLLEQLDRAVGGCCVFTLR